MPLRPTTVTAPLALGLSLLLSSCHRDEVTHFHVVKSPAEASAGGLPDAMASHQRAAAAPGADEGLSPPPAPDQGLRWSLPKGWSEERQGGMRYATLKAPVRGRIDASVVVLPGPAGGELMNVNRWRGQIGLAPIDDAALGAARKVLKTRAGALSVYDFTSEGQKKSRLIAGLLEAGGSTWFVKVTGDAEAVDAARTDFLSLLGSLRLE